MITIKTQMMEVKREDNRMLSANYSMGSIFLKFIDQIEMTIPYEGDTGKMNVVMNMLINTKAKNVTIDLTNKDEIISFG